MNILSVLNKDPNLKNSISFGDKFIYFNRECNLKHWDSFFDKENNIQLIILGRPIIEITDWASYNDSDLNFITKFLIKKYIELNIDDFCNQLNGAFSILVIDYKLNRLSIITDKLGIYPIYTFAIFACTIFHHLMYNHPTIYNIVADNPITTPYSIELDAYHQLIANLY